MTADNGLASKWQEKKIKWLFKRRTAFGNNWKRVTDENAAKIHGITEIEKGK